MTTRPERWLFPLLAPIAAACSAPEAEAQDPAGSACQGADAGRYCVTSLDTTGEDGAGGEGGADAVSDASGGAAEVETKCRVLRGVVRDFRRGDQRGGHPDFETYWGVGEPGLVASELDARGKPSLVATEPQTIRSSATFAEWYQDVPGENVAFGLTLEFDVDGEELTFGSPQFFPLDNLGFGNEGFPRNYGFTTELHATFRYDGRPDAVFTFIGDDDLWVYVNGRLAIDLGGVHPPMTASLLLEEHAAELGLVDGHEYSIDLFHAERRSTLSSFEVRTNLRFVGCPEP